MIVGLGVLARVSPEFKAAATDISPTLLLLAHDIDHALTTATRGLHTAGYSWADIAARLGITRQAAHQRWGPRPDRDTR